MRTAARKDSNQDEIVKAQRIAGASVALTHQLGGGFPDLVVGAPREICCPSCAHEFTVPYNWMQEVKDGDKPPSKRILTPEEQNWHEAWKGQVDIVYSVDDALMLIGSIC